MKIKSFQGGFDKNFCYLLWCDETKFAAIVDPSVNITPVIEFIERSNLILSKILITHTHHDHILYLNEYIHLFPNIDVICHESHIKKFQHYITKITDYEIITLGQEILIAIHTPGHYIDSICFWNKKDNCIFTGDTIFVGRTGRTVSNNSDIEDLYNSVYQKILTLPIDTIIYPGHNYGFSKTITINENIALSEFFSCKTFKEFKLVMHKFEASR